MITVHKVFVQSTSHDMARSRNEEQLYSFDRMMDKDTDQVMACAKDSKHLKDFAFRHTLLSLRKHCKLPAYGCQLELCSVNISLATPLQIFLSKPVVVLNKFTLQRESPSIAFCASPRSLLYR